MVWQSGGVRQKLLTSKRPRGRRSLEEIRCLLNAHAQSGVSLLAFAQAHDLCYASLRRWRTTHATALEVRTHGRERRRRQPSPGFIPVQIENPVPSGEFTVCWPGGRALRIPAGFDPEQLRRLLQVLEAQS